MRTEGRRHLRRLDRVYLPAPIYYITGCVGDRDPVLASPRPAEILVQAWRDSPAINGWMIGRYQIMPDHIHFFTAAGGREDGKDLSQFMSDWKRWAKRQIRASGLRSFGWQDEFFDHVLRSSESYEEKWEYVRMNPVRAGLVSNADDWPYQGEIHPLEW